MIIVRGKTDYASVENLFEDSDAEKAFDYHSEIEDLGWTTVKMIHLHGLTVDSYYRKKFNYKGYNDNKK